MKKNLIDNLGLAATGASMIATCLSNWFNDKKLDERIEEKVNEAIAKRFGNES